MAHPPGAVYPPGVAYPQYGGVPNITAQFGDMSIGRNLLVNGAVVHLWSKKSGYTLMISDHGNVSAKGRNDDHAKFIVHTNQHGAVSLQNKKSPTHWLAIKKDHIVGNGSGGPFCQFIVVDSGHGFISLESVQARGHYIGVTDVGDCKSHLSGGITDDEKFYVIPVQPGSGQTVSPGSRLLIDGAKVRLWSFAHGMNVRITDNGVVDGMGWSGLAALYTVHSRGQGIVALQNVQNPNRWIAINNGQTVGTGTGGPFTHLLVHDSEHGTVCFESVQHLEQHLGILDDGSLKPPGSTHKGKHGRFHIIVDVPATAGFLMPSQGGVPSPMTYPQPGAHSQPSVSPQPQAMAQPAQQHLLVKGAVVHLWSKKSGYSLKIGDHGDVSAKGRNGDYAKFIVHTNQYGAVSLQNKKSPNHWLAIKKDHIVGNGSGGQFCQFNVIVHEHGFISLESVQARGHYIGVTDVGDCKSHLSGGINDNEKFYVIPVQPAGRHAVPPGSKFLTDGAKVRLWSFAHGMNVRITDSGTVDGSGRSGMHALYTVHSRGQGIVALQNVQNPNHWIAIKSAQTVGTGTGGPFTHLRVHNSDHGMVCFESVQHPGQHLGILDDGSLKPPGSTGKGKHGRFHIVLS